MFWSVSLTPQGLRSLVWSHFIWVPCFSRCSAEQTRHWDIYTYSRGLSFTLGAWDLRVCSLDVAFASATVRNQAQPFETVRNRSREVGMAVPPVSAAKAVAFGGFKRGPTLFRVVSVALHDSPTCFITCRKSFCVTGAILLRRFQKISSIFSWQAQHFDIRVDFAWQAQHGAALYTFGVACCLRHCQGCVKQWQRANRVWQAWDIVRVSFCVAAAIFAADPSCVCVAIHTLHFTLYTPHSTLSTLHLALHTLHFTLHTLHSTLHTPHSTLYTLRFTRYTSHITLYTSHSTIYTLHSILYILHFRLYTLHSTHYTWHCTLNTLHSTLYTLHLIIALDSPHSTLYTLHFTLQALPFTLCTSHFALDTPHSTLYTWHLTLRTLRFTLYTLYFKLHALHFTLRTLPLTLHTLYTLTPHSTLYTPRWQRANCVAGVGHRESLL